MIIFLPKLGYRVCIVCDTKDLSKAIDRKQEAIAHLHSKWAVSSTEEDAIMEELKHSEEELHSLISSLRAVIQGNLLALLMHYFCCFEAFMMETDKPRSEETCFPYLHSILNFQHDADFFEFMRMDEKRDLLLDDCYCLVAFLKERKKQLEKETHSIVICNNAEIAGAFFLSPLHFIDTIGKMTKEDLCDGITCLEGIISLIETRIITVVRLAMDESFRQSIAEDIVKEVRLAG